MASVTPAGTASSDEAVKPLRADAQRNYDSLVRAARDAFRENGAQASLDDIAKRAGVGPGTLYRHFPTRDDLIDAVMREWTLQVDADSDDVIASDLSAAETLDAWFGRFVESIGIYRGAAAKLTEAMDDPTSPIFRKCQVLAVANDKVIDHVASLGGLREGIDSREVMRLVSGVANVVDQAGLDPEQAEPMLRIVINGILRDPAAS